MTTYTYTPSNAVLNHCIEKACQEYNAAAGTSLTPQQYWAAACEARAQEFGRRFARISGVSAVRRFSGGEWTRINALVASNPDFAAVAQPLLEGQRCELAGDPWQNGVSLLATIPGLLDTPVADRVAALKAPPGPNEPLV